MPDCIVNATARRRSALDGFRACAPERRACAVYRRRSLEHRIRPTGPTRRDGRPTTRQGGTSVPATPALDTFPRLLLHHAATRGRHPATREKDLGIWQTWTWSQVEDEVRALACGLAAQGFKRGMNLAIIGDNRPRLYWAMAAAQALGGVPVPLYQDAVAAEMVYVLNDAEVHFAIVEDQEQVDKLLEIRDRCPTLEHIVFDDPRGLAPLHAGFPARLRRHPGDGTRAARGAPGLFRGRGGAGPLRRRGRDGLHVGDDRQAEGRVPDAQRADRRGPRRRRVRPAHARRGRAVVPADGVDRRSPVLLLRGARTRASRSIVRSPAIR